jgi:hypothetical protein
MTFLGVQLMRGWWAAKQKNDGTGIGDLVLVEGRDRTEFAETHRRGGKYRRSCTVD